ncbi:hypothetical protein B0H10DRAFT_2225364 [Mycena sp. CBHHK59/15]|nr:hypothetical protein B0H10DRAFT_2225364 [Mycena sp. CBHHK59/15]
MTNGIGASSSSQQAPPLPPPCERKMHSLQAVILALKDLPTDIRHKKNTEIKGRNTERALQHAKHLEKLLHTTDVSDDKSMIMAKDLLRTLPFFGGRDKRMREEDSDERKAAKKIREEIVLQPSMSLPVAFHSLLFDLRAHDVYIPLSLFTSPNLELIKFLFRDAHHKET